MKNYPHFNVNNLPLEVTNNYMAAVIAEERRVCDPIDKRILEVENEYLSMSNQLEVISDTMNNAGFFARWGIQSKMKALAKRMAWHRAVIAKLYNARLKRTYG